MNQFIPDAPALVALCVLGAAYLVAAFFFIAGSCRVSAHADRMSNRHQRSLDRAAEGRGKIHISHVGASK